MLALVTVLAPAWRRALRRTVAWLPADVASSLRDGYAVMPDGAGDALLALYLAPERAGILRPKISWAC